MIDPITGLPSSNTQQVYAGDKPIASQVITASSMTPVPKVDVPAPVTVPSSTYTAPITEISSSVQSSLATQEAERNANAELERARASAGDIARLQAEMGNKGADKASTYASTGVNAAYNQLQDYNAQLKSLALDATGIPIQLQSESQGRGRTGAGIAPIETARLRDNALKALTVGQGAAIAEGNYNKAKNLADQQIDIKYAQMEADLESKKTQLASLEKYQLSPAQEKAKQARERENAKEERDIAEKKANDKEVTNLVVNAAAQGAPEEIRERASKAKSPMEAANILGVYAGDYLKNELLKEQLKQVRVKTAGVGADGREIVTQNGVPLVKVTPKEIQDLNDTQIAKNSLVSLVDGMISSIDKYGTQVLFGKEAGTRSGAKTNLLLAMKNLEKTGALDKGTIDVLTGTIPSSEFFATEGAQKAALQQLKDTVNGKVDEYIGSYRGTTAETDPRTKRIYEGSSGVVSSGNPALDNWYGMTAKAISTVNSSPTGASYYGFIDNKK